MKNIRLSIFLFVCFLGFALPTEVTFAQEMTTGLAQLSQCTGTDCSACNIVHLANGVIKWLIGILFVIFACLLAYAGVKLVIAGGNSHALDEAKSMFLNALIGFLIILSAWLIVDTIMRALVGTRENPGQLVADGSATGYLFWSEVQCQEMYVPIDTGQTTLEYDNESLSVSCTDVNATRAEIIAAGCIINTCTTTACLTSCNNIQQGIDLGYANNNDYCINAPAGVAGGGSPLITQPSGQLCFSGQNCFAAVSGIAGQANYQYPSGYRYTPDRWIDTFNPGPGMSMSSRVSANYTLGELNVSGTCGNGGRYMYVNPSALAALERVNQAVGRKLSLNSVHRSPGCNSRVGGAASSFHMSGTAFDIQPGGLSKARLMELCREQGAGYVSEYESTSHVHCDWGPRR